MKLNTHPRVNEINAKCACGASYKVASTLAEINVTICSNCHPFFTGEQKLVDTAGRVEKFNKKYKSPADALAAPVAGKEKKEV